LSNLFDCWSSEVFVAAFAQAFYLLLASA